MPLGTKGVSLKAALLELCRGGSGGERGAAGVRKRGCCYSGKRWQAPEGLERRGGWAVETDGAVKQTSVTNL